VTGLAVSSSTRLSLVVAWNALATDVLSTGNTPITAYYIERSCSNCTTGWFHLSSNSLATSLTITLAADETLGMTYSKTYTVRVTPINICGLGKFSTTLSVTTKVPPSAPSIAYPPVKNVLSATLISLSWPAIPSTNEDLTGGYPITSYQLLQAISPA
jgi:hypothetical protein